MSLEQAEAWLRAHSLGEELGEPIAGGICLECGHVAVVRFVIGGDRCCVALCRICARRRRRAAALPGVEVVREWSGSEPPPPSNAR